MTQYNKIRAVVAVAGVIRRDGTVFTEDWLRSQSDGVHYFYDEATKSLAYEGNSILDRWDWDTGNVEITFE